jgi:hypothetical protein
LSWCDKLAATPGVGFRVDFRFESSDALLQALSPMLSTWVDGDKPTFSVQRNDFLLNISSHDGYVYTIEPTKIGIAFQHTMKWRLVGGGPPIAEMLSRPLPYTKLLPEVTKRLIDTTSRVFSGNPRKIMRVGIVASTAVAADEIPPGIARFVAYMRRPWKGAADYYSFNITATLADDSQWSDRCIHVVTKLEDDPEKQVRLNFDWQRTFKTGQPITPESMIKLAERAQEAAMQYFEDLAEGNRFDEKLINEAT